MGATERYLLGQLSEEERERFEEHYFECRDCAEELKSANTFIANAKEVLSDAPAPKISPAPSVPKRTGWASFFWPAPVGALAAALLLATAAGYQALLVVPRLQHELTEAQGLQAAPWSFLSVSRSEAQVVRVPRGTRMAGLTLSRSTDQSFPYYRCEVQDEGGRVVASAVVAARHEGDELEILLPVSRLQPGAHALVVRGLQSRSRSWDQTVAEIGRYPFTLEYNEEE